MNIKFKQARSFRPSRGLKTQKKLSKEDNPEFDFALISPTEYMKVKEITLFYETAKEWRPGTWWLLPRYQFKFDNIRAKNISF